MESLLNGRFQVCNGNSTEYCGGPNHVSVYKARQASDTLPDGWSAIGCYTDDVVARTLPTRQFPPGDMTTESCLSACKAGGFKYAGTEYADECYCGNSFENDGGPAPDGNAQCNMNCTGNAQVYPQSLASDNLASDRIRKFVADPIG